MVEWSGIKINDVCETEDVVLLRMSFSFQPSVH